MFISLIIFLVVLGIIAYLVGLIPMDVTIAQVIRVVFIIIAIFAVLDAIGFTHLGLLNSFWLGRN